MEGSTCTEMNRALTSYDVITSPGSSLFILDLLDKMLCNFEVVGDWPTKGLMMYYFLVSIPTWGSFNTANYILLPLYPYSSPHTPLYSSAI